MPTPQRSFIALGTDGNDAVMVGSDGTLWKQSGATWVQLAGIPNAGTVARVPIGAASYGASDEVVILVRTVGMGPETQLMILSAGVWVNIGKPPHTTDEKRLRQVIGLSRYDAGDLAVVCDDGSIFVYASSAWTEVSGPPRSGT